MKNSKKRILALLLALLMVISLLPATALAAEPVSEEDTVVSVNFNDGSILYGYASLADAVEAAGTTAATLTMLKDETLTEGVVIPENAIITLNFNGHTISTSTVEAMLTNNGNLTITDSTAYVSETAVEGSYELENGSGYYVSGGLISKLAYAGNKPYAIVNNGTLSISGGAFVSEYLAICNNGVVPNYSDAYIKGAAAVARVDFINGMPVYCDSVDAAVSAAGSNHAVITLLQDVNLGYYDLTIPAAADITLELNGFIISSEAVYTVYNNGTLSIQDSTAYTSASNVPGAYKLYDYESGSDYWYVSGGLVNVYGNGYAIFNAGTIGKISGGAFISGAGTAVFIERNGKIGEISGGYFYGLTCVVSMRGSIDLISGGYFATGTDSTASYNTMELHYTDYEGVEYYSSIGEISGGTFTGQNGALWLNKGASIGIISGGYFTAQNYSAVQVAGYSHIGEISGGTFIQKFNSAIYLGSGYYIDGTDWVATPDNCGKIDLISGGYFEGCTWGVIENDGGSVTISGGVFENNNGGNYKNALVSYDWGHFKLSGGYYRSYGGADIWDNGNCISFESGYGLSTGTNDEGYYFVAPVGELLGPAALPAITFSYDGGAAAAITSNASYSVSYKAGGSYTLTLTGVGNTIAVTDNGASLEPSVNGTTYTYSFSGTWTQTHTIIITASESGCSKSSRTISLFLSGASIDDELVTAGTALITNDGVYPWSQDSTNAGRIAFKSGNAGVADSTSTLTVTVYGKGTASFYMSASTFKVGDYFEIYMDGEEFYRKDESPSWGQMTYAFTTNGAHTVTFSYAKDSVSDYGSDCAWVSDFRWSPASEVTSLQVETELYAYPLGSSLDMSGISVMASYADGSVGDVTGICNYSYDFSTAGEKTVRIVCGTVETSFTVLVCQEAVLPVITFAYDDIPETDITQDSVYHLDSAGGEASFTLTLGESGYDITVSCIGSGLGAQELYQSGRTYSYSGIWNDNYTITVTASGEGYYPVSRIISMQLPTVAKIGEREFGTLESALAAAETGDTVILTDNYSMMNNATIPAGVTLLIPFSESDTTGTKDGASTTRVALSYESTYLYKTLTIPEGKTLTINGSLIIGGVQNGSDQMAQGRTSGAFSKIACNGDIKINGTLKLYGLISGSGTTELNASGTMYMPYMVTDYSGGQNTYSLFGANVFPFGQYATSNVQNTFVMHGGAVLMGMTALYQSSTITHQDIGLVGPEGSSTAYLIYLPTGSTLTATYDGTKYINGNAGTIQYTDSSATGNITLNDFGKTTLTLSGGATFGGFSLSGYSSGDMYLQIPYTYDLVLANGTYTMGGTYKYYRIMPGATITIANGATLNVTGGLQVTDGWQQADKSGKIYPTTAVLEANGYSKSGILIVNGTLNVSGTFVGVAQTTGSTGTVVLGSGATLSGTFTSGSTGGYTDSYVSFPLSARAYINGALTALTAGKTYYAAGNSGWSLETYTVSANRITTGETVTINQPMTGVWMTNGLTFDAQADEVANPDTITCAAGTSITLPAAERTGYTFNGWYTDAACSDGNKFENTTMPRLPYTLYAKWTINRYSITFNTDGGSDVVAITADYGATVTAPVNPTKTGYTFVGWYADEYLNTEYTFTTMPLNGATLYAKWTANQYTVTLIPGDGAAISSTSLNVTYDAEYGTIPMPTKAGYVFQGWKLTGTETDVTAATKVSQTSDHSLTAQWIASSNMTYKVMHFGEDLEGKYTSYLGMDDKSDGTTGATLTAQPNNYSGFTYNDSQSSGSKTLTISADGNTTFCLYYSRNSYTVTYKDGDSTVSSGFYKYGANLTDLYNYSKTGYTMNGWYANAALDESAPTTMPADALTLYAKTTVNQYTVTFDVSSNGGTVSPASKSVTYDSTYGELPTPTKTGYDFKGWFTAADGGMQVISSTSVAITAAQMLYAQWTVHPYSITYVINGGTNAEDNPTTYTIAGAVTPYDPTKSGYRFDGWKEGGAIASGSYGDKTFTASWTSYLDLLNAIEDVSGDLSTAREYYNLLNDDQKQLYDTSDLFEAIRSYSENAMKAAVANAVSPTNEILADQSNTYIGNYLSEGADAVALIANNQMAVDVEFIDPAFPAYNMLNVEFLTALFGHEEIKSIQIDNTPVYELTGKSVLESIADSDQFHIMYNIAWAALDPTVEDSTFFSYLYAQKDTMAISVLDGKTVTATLYAKTVEGVEYSVEYTITFFNQNHTVTWDADGTATQVVYAYGASIAAPAAPTKSGYTFAGWSGFTTGAIMGKTNVTYNAQFTPNECTVSFNLNYADAENPADQSATYDSPYGTLPSPSREGYTFEGWYLNDEKFESTSTVSIAEDHTLTARWSVGASYSVTYDLDGGSVASENRTQYNVETETFTLNNPTKTGYTFKGWSGTGLTGDENLTVTVNKGSTGSKSFTANWIVNSYTITFSSNGGSAVAAITQDYGTAVTAPLAPTKTGYAFTGWDEAVPATMPASDMTITAQWTINKYTITFDSDGGSTVSAITADYGAVVSAPTAPTKTGYTFAGWDKSIPDTMPAEGVTIKALWTVDRHTITFNSNSGSTVDAITQDYGTAVEAPDDPTRSGYTFTGWDEAVPATMPAVDKTLTAQWSANNYTVTLNANGGTVSPASITVTYDGTYAELPTPTRTGYSFVGWFDGDTQINKDTTVSITAAHTLTAKWNAKGDTPYVVKHYQQNLSGSDYTLVKTENLNGATDTTAEASWQTYTGFAQNTGCSTASGNIAADGSLELSLYYDRNIYTVTWNVNGTETQETYRFGAVPSAPATDRADDLNGSYTFTSWDKTVGSVTEDVTYTAQYSKSFEASIGSVTYRTLALAIANAKSGDVVRLAADVTLTADLTVPSGVTLLIPCMDYDAGLVSYGAVKFNPHGTDTSTKTGVGPNAALYCTLTIPEDVTLTVNGTVLVNAVTGRPVAGHYDQDVTGGYAQINLNGSIVVCGTLECFGYIKGSGTVTAESGGSVSDLYVVRNWRGGTQAGEMYQSKYNVYPMNEYDCHNIETDIVIKSGASYIGLVKMYASDSYYFTRFPQVSNSNGLIRLTTEDSYVVRSYDGTREIYKIYGGAQFASSTLTIVGMNLSTKTFIYPIDGDISFYLADGSYSFANDFKFLTGSSMEVAQDAVLTVDEGVKVVFYDEFNDVGNTDSTQYPVRDTAVLNLVSGAAFCNNGTFAGTINTSDDNVSAGEGASWCVSTKEANGYCNGVVDLSFALAINRSGYTWSFGENSVNIVWHGADYSVVQAAIAAIPEDLTGYTQQSVTAVTSAKNAVVYGLGTDHQSDVTAMAAAINNAVSGLTYKTITLTFDAGEGECGTATMQVTYGDTYADIPMAARSGYTFGGWYTKDNIRISAGNKVLLEENTVLTAKWAANDSTYPTANHFSDIETGAWYHEAVDYVILRGLMNGMEADTFGTNLPTLRGQIVAILYRLAGEPEATGENIYKDVEDSMYFTDAIIWATENNIVNGYGDGSFSPMDPITREQMAAILWRFAEYKGYDLSAMADLSGFVDEDDIHTWATDAMSWANANELISGLPGSILAPQNNAVRVQVAAILMRFCENMAK